jgi:hypothetical protein
MSVRKTPAKGIAQSQGRQKSRNQAPPHIDRRSIARRQDPGAQNLESHEDGPRDSDHDLQDPIRFHACSFVAVSHGLGHYGVWVGLCLWNELRFPED